ncbi:MAG: hypothetical protein ABII79_14090 [bacterium]
MAVIGDINQDGYVDFVYPLWDRLVFANLAGNPYDANDAYKPMLGYNRRLNHTARLSSEVVIVCGDMNGDGLGPDVADIVFYVAFLFRGGPAPPDLNLADVDNSDALDVGDLTCLVAYLFQGGPAPNCPPVQ